MESKRKVLLVCTCLLSVFDLYAQLLNILPSKAQLKWADAEIGVLIHYDINVFAEGGVDAVDYSKKETLPPLSVFNPTKLNTDQWLASAKKAGARYAILVAKHGTGFSLWPSKANDYTISKTPFRDGNGDIVKDFIASCKKYNIKPGIYYNTNSNAYYGAGYTTLSEEQTSNYNEVVYDQLQEIWSRYGSLFEIWFDGGVMANRKNGIGEKVSALLRKYQSGAILFQGPLSEKNLIRWVGNEGGRAPYPNWSRSDANTSANGLVQIPDLNGNPDGKYWIPGETDFANRKNGGWMWKAKDEDQQPFSANELLDRYYTSVGRNSNMLIGMVIDTAGLFPQKDMLVFQEFGKKLAERSRSVTGRISGKGNSLLINFKTAKEINQVELKEEIAYGERVRSYTVEVLTDGNWRKICSGTSIGHKRIQIFDKTRTSAVRLTITKSRGEPILKGFSTYLYQ